MPDLGTSETVRPIRVRMAESDQDIKRNRDIGGQFVDIIDNSNISKSPNDDARFLSDRNRRVEREMQARVTGLPSAVGGGGGGGRRPSPPRGSGGIDLSVPRPFLESASQGAVGQGGSQRTATLSPSNYLPGIEFGNETLLNTREWAYATFFIRMKRQMEAVWNPLRWIDPRRNGRDEYITSVRIFLHADGSLDRVHLIETSGSAALDREALQAVRDGAPYLNPPSDLAGEDRSIEIGPWRFIVSLKASM
jgi:TonB family protein